MFNVPFGERMMEMTAGPNFVLGMQDGPLYQLNHAQILHAGIQKARGRARNRRAPVDQIRRGEIVAGCGGRLDAIEELITRIPTLLCESYYGVPIADKLRFAQWTIAMSGYLFGPPGKRPENAGTAVAAANCIRPVIDSAIRDTKAAANRPDTVLARFVAMQEQGAEGLTDEVIRGHLFGMIIGFVPTNTIAAGNVLEMLLRRPDFMARARAAAFADEDDLVRRVPVRGDALHADQSGAVPRLQRGLHHCQRHARRDNDPRRDQVAGQHPVGDVRRTQGRKADRVQPGACARARITCSFGHGLHWCIGAYIVEAQITQTFKPLLKRNGLRRAGGAAGQMHRLSVFPVHLVVEFDR